MTTFSGKELECYFRDLLLETRPIEEIGSWWESSRSNNDSEDSQHEIDIVAIYYKEERVLWAEVKRQRRSFDAAKFQKKVEHIKTKLFARYKIDTACFSIEDI